MILIRTTSIRTWFRGVLGLSALVALASDLPAQNKDGVVPPKPPSRIRIITSGPALPVKTRALIDKVETETKPNWVPEAYKLLYEQNFQSPAALKDFAFTDVKAWKVAPVKGSKGGLALELAVQSKYQPPFRSPVNIALLADKVFTDFILEVDLKQTGREYGHRDMCLFYGVESPAHFYYTHLATKADEHAHNVFIVKDAPRTKIARKTTEGVNWGLEVWHKVRLERKGSDGTIKVYYDDMTQPIMVAQDTTFPSGYIGFGSFDDTGMVDNIRIWGPAMEMKKTEFFSRP
jgi:hypothetical protein